MLLKVDFH